MIVHDIFNGCSMDISKEPNSGLESCAWGNKTSLNARQEATVHWRNKCSPTCNTLEH
jgi:hypothetical protein